MEPDTHFRSLNHRLIRGDPIAFFDGTGVAPPASMGDGDRSLVYPRIGIYAGTGTSHSWLWYVDIFDRMGFYDLAFLTEEDIQGDGLDPVQVLAMSGGDTFAIAEGLGEAGASKIEAFIRSGGLYMGSCAGAYLPLNSSKPFLNLFNFVPARITNLTRTLPEPIRMKEKFCTAYGCSFIFHPVRETVAVKTNGFAPFGKPKRILAPLYGGPPMTVGNRSAVLATYTGFTDKTLFLVDPALAKKTLIGNAAVIRERMGRGHLHLYGPHFEHPRFHMANALLARAMYWDSPADRGTASPAAPPRSAVTGNSLKAFVRDLKREVSNARIVAAGLEMRPVRWTLGKKVYDPAKIRVFLDAIWSRLRAVEQAERVLLTPGQDAAIIRQAAMVTTRIREMKRGLDRGMDTLERADVLFTDLRQSCTLFLDVYFRTMMNQFGGHHAV
ncbi:MAG: BPL-N domain-containing protein [Deltaproteobacteria bacterium]|nr:BPL-N domain-containing protein [Deltaproteobacteria bacterium]